MQLPPLTRSLGLAERSLRALLEQKLQGANLSFAEWTALAFTSAAPLDSREVIQRQLTGRITDDTEGSQESIDSLVTDGLLTQDHDAVLAHSDKGKTVFAHVSGMIEGLTRDLYGDLPIEDLEATHRTLTEISQRAGKLLARPG